MAGSITKKILEGSLVGQIIVGMILGIVLAWLSPEAAKSVSFLGSFFVGGLKAVAPVLVFVLVTAAITQHQTHSEVYIKPIVFLYLAGTFCAALTAVVASFLFPTSLTLVTANVSQVPPSGILEVLRTLVMKIVDNPVHAIANANYIGILSWAILLGITFRKLSDSTKTVLADLAAGVSQIVRWVIRLAPIGIFGLVASTIATTGFGELANYGRILLVLVGAMFFVALVINPILAFFFIRKNPFPLVFTCLAQSGITAFFTRSSAANIPVNMALCKKLDLHEDTYSISIPLGATINMAGAAITSTGSNHQYGRSSNHHHRAFSGCGTYPWYQGRSLHRCTPLCTFSAWCLRSIRCSRWFAAIDSDGMQSVWHQPGYLHPGYCRRFYYWSCTGFL